MALPRFKTIGFRAAVHKPMGDVTDVTSISFIQSMIFFSVLSAEPGAYFKWGVMTVAPTSDSIWLMTKPLTAMHASPDSNRRRIPDCCVNSLSDIEPVNSFEIKVITSHGAILIRPLKVLVFL